MTFTLKTTTGFEFNNFNLKSQKLTHSKCIQIGSNGDIVRLNWAPAFEGKSDPASYTDAYLQAYRKMAQLIDDSPTRMTRRLNPGECLSKFSQVIRIFYNNIESL